MTPVQKLELRMSDLRRELADALEADAPDPETVQRLTGELRAADANLVAAKLLAPDPEETVTETRQFDSKLAELRESVDLTKHVKAALAGTVAQGGPEAEYNDEMKIDAGWFPLDLLTRQAEERAKRAGDGMASQATWLDYLFAGTAAERLGITFRPVGSGTHSVPTFSAARGRELAALLDPETSVPGVTSGTLRPQMAAIALPSTADGHNMAEDDFALTAGWGHFGTGDAVMPGTGRSVARDYTPPEREALGNAAGALGVTTVDVHLNGNARWTNVPAAVWNYKLGGYQVLKKWLSYREHKILGRNMHPDDVRHFTDTARRIATILMLTARP